MDMQWFSRNDPGEEPELTWEVSLKEAGESEFEAYPMENLQNLAAQKPFFNGTLRYEAVWNTDAPESCYWLEFPVSTFLPLQPLGLIGNPFLG